MRILAFTLLAACSGDAPIDAPPPDAACGPNCEGPLFPVTATWAFFPTLGGPSGPCPASVVDVEVYLETGGMFSFPCSAGRGDVMVPLTPNQRVFGRAVDAEGHSVVASVPRALSAPETFSIAFYEDAGFIRVFATMGTCNGPPASLRARDANGVTFTKTYDCNTDADVRRGVMISNPLRPGTYDITVAAGVNAPFTRQGVVVGTNDAVTDIDLTAP